MKWLALVLGLSSFSLGSCRTSAPPPATTVLQSAPAAVTRLETPTSIEPTRLESGSTTPTSTTTITVQQAITDLQAQRTSEGLKVNLPENILFDFDKAEIRPNAKPTLQKLSVLLKSYQNSPTEIRGYTDSKGSDQYNQDYQSDVLKRSRLI